MVRYRLISSTGSSAVCPGVDIVPTMLLESFVTGVVGLEMVRFGGVKARCCDDDDAVCCLCWLMLMLRVP